MARWAIGDVQGCDDELAALLERIRFRSGRDELWFTGDIVNRGPGSLAALRRVRDFGAGARTVLGNHDLHLLAVALVPGHELRRGDTLGDILAAPDRDALLEWLIEQPLALHDVRRGELLVHAGLVPQWSAADAAALSAEVCAALRADPRRVLGRMYGDRPDQWDDRLRGMERIRFVINVLTRIRVCTADGRVDMKQKGAPAEARPPWRPWFQARPRASAGTRVVFGHWSTLGLHRADGVLGLDTGCVWGGALTAVNLDDPEAPAVAIPARGRAYED